MLERSDSCMSSFASGTRRLSRLLTLGAAMLLCSSALSAQVISGKVSDSESGQPLAGARVSVGNGAQGAIARADGTYRLPVSAGTHIV
ncbi:MAG: carboxypeptidase regulatory-like domain-containing protein, partial [Gemmatimonadales bacterium]